MTASNNKPISTEDLIAFKAYLEEYTAWGSLHIVLEDGNVRDKHVQFCIDHARQRGDIEGERLARILLSKSESQRINIHRRLAILHTEM